jgi:sugar transferase (PEP-CTERM/EpsH1 system associated)
MQALLYLVHRLPYPPNTGDRSRAYHVLRYLGRRYRVFLGTFADVPHHQALVDHLGGYCAQVKVVAPSPLRARARCFAGLFRGEPLTLAWYRNAALQRWVDDTVAAQNIRIAVCFSSAMMPYLDRPNSPKLVADFCDVDSEKWAQYARGRGWPASFLYGREARRLLEFERRIAARAHACTFAAPAEVELFKRLAPESAAKLHAIGNGVDTEYFSPSADRPSPYGPGELPIVFTGAMDYWPNIDAVTWFCSEAMPLVLRSQPRARFYVVGANPAAAVSALAGPHMVVTGGVADVRPYLQHARVAIAPLRLARGAQNKVIEAMAMGRPVVVSAAVAQTVEAAPLLEFEVANDAREFAHKVLALMEPPAGDDMGRQARRRAVNDYNWEAQLSRIDRLLEAASAPRPSLAG